MWTSPEVSRAKISEIAISGVIFPQYFPSCSASTLKVINMSLYRRRTDIAGPKSPNIDEKTYAISRFKTYILQMPKSLIKPIYIAGMARLFEVFIRNYCKCVLNDLIFQNKISPLNFWLICTLLNLNLLLTRRLDFGQRVAIHHLIAFYDA